MPTLRVATFNVENLFARFTFNSNADPDKAVQGWLGGPTRPTSSASRARRRRSPARRLRRPTVRSSWKSRCERAPLPAQVHVVSMNLARPSLHSLHGACLVAVVVAVAVAPAGRAAEAGALKLEIAPDKVSLESAGSRKLLVIARNSGFDARNVKLSWLPAARISVTPTQETKQLVVARLPKGGDTAWQLDVSARPAARAQKLFFFVDYTSGGVGKVATASVEVENATPEKVEDVAAVEVKTTLESLDRSNPGVVYLIVTNKLATTLTVDQVDAKGPESVEFAGPKEAVMIGAQQSTALEVDVTAKERVRPGKHLLLFDLHLSWDDDREARVITTQQAQIGIAGESAILTLLGVPTFLLLPGFLIMLAIATWWRFGVLRPGGAPAQAPWEVTKPDFWALAITASIAIGFLYPRLGGVDYLHGAYGLIDVVVVWVASLLIGTVIWFAVMGTRRIRHELRTPTADDDPTTLIRRLGRQRLTLERPRFDFTSPANFAGYLAQPRRDGAEMWLAPPITVKVKAGTSDGNALSKRLQEQDDAKELAKLLKSRRADLTISWQQGNGPGRPYRKTAAELNGATEHPAERIVRAS